MSLRGSNTSTRAGWPGPTPSIWIRVSASPATTCALVITRSGATTQPLPSTPRPQAVPNTRTTLWRASLTPLLARMRRVGAGTSGAGPRTDGSGSNRARALRIGPEGGRIRSSARRMVESWMSERSGCDVEASRATAPIIQAIAQPHAGGQGRAEQAVHRPQAGEAQRRADPRADALQSAGEHPAGQQGPQEPEQRGVGRPRAVAEQQRRQPRADKRPHREAHQGQRADDEPLDVAVEGQQHGEADDQPVKRGHDWVSG